MVNQQQERSLISRAWYLSDISTFLNTNAGSIIGELTRNSDFSVTPPQRDAWLGQIENLQEVLLDREGFIALEFSIPRMGRRIDAVVILGPVCLVIEYKVGEDSYPTYAIEQVWDYALDLKNFHKGSHFIPIVPILVSTESNRIEEPLELVRDPDDVFRPISTSNRGLKRVLDHVISNVKGAPIDTSNWVNAPYQPTPTILEAARALYANHSVADIARNDAGAINLAITSERLDRILDHAIANRKKIICFVTGVPGAGKTLVGLNLATRHRRELESPTHASFLSGNGPLVSVLREALTVDEVDRRREQGEKVRKGCVLAKVKSVIQNVHHFRDEYIQDQNAPFDHVVIFDEAQRAWNLKQTAGFMLRRKKIEGFDKSEPDFLISCMDRHDDWAVIVCLVGGGQEIHTGEAGIGAWLNAINRNYPDWHAYISSRLKDSEYQAQGQLRTIKERPNTLFDDSLHLSVSMRSFRAESVSTFIKAILDCELEEARHQLAALKGKYPIVITRNLDRAKQWVRENARGSERFGLMASSRAQRLKPHAIDVRVNVNPIHWFLKDRSDTRSSFYLEDAATEFQVQGLELDWGCVTWDGDLRYLGQSWSCHDFRGSNWVNVRQEIRQHYVINAYRVLLTRSRQGMAIFIPEGDKSDPTRLPENYDPTFEYLSEIGIESI